MARKARHRISYVLPLPNSQGGHLLGVNGLAVDRDRSILYSGGRDGVIGAWDLHLDLAPTATAVTSAPATTWRGQIQAHTHWINDIVLAQKETALVSASSDLTVKVWRPHADDHASPHTLGLHSDYVKCLSTPQTHASWVASGGLDHKICLWDLNGAGLKLEIDVGEGQNTAKGSVYALSVGESIMASGGPESIVRVWDPRTGRRITKLVGHTDNVRAVLINQAGDNIVTASSDQTVKVWSVTAGRCLHTLTMHNDSVWSLASDHPQLSVFHSSDRSGLVAKTDVRGAAEMEQGLCLAVCQEHDGVSKVISAGAHVWTATSSSSINRWADVNTTPYLPPPALQPSVPIGPPRRKNSAQPSPLDLPLAPGGGSKPVPLQSMLPLANIPHFHTGGTRDADATTIASAHSARKRIVTSAKREADVEADADAEADGTADIVIPYCSAPEESIQGQHGLIKHFMLNDRRRVLTLDTAGEVVLWDLVRCEPIRSFGKRHLEDVAPEVNTTESVANWCAVDTRTGRLACVLEENHCFDAEMYADELEPQEGLEFRDDQRINLGKWILRYLFATFIDEELRRDESYRLGMSEGREQQTRVRRGNAPGSIQMPPSTMANGSDPSHSLHPPGTAGGVNGHSWPLTTPGLGIGVATPSIVSVPVPVAAAASVAGESVAAQTIDEQSEQDQRSSHYSQPRSSTERSVDYFSAGPNGPSASGVGDGAGTSNGPATGPPSDAGEERLPTSPSGPDKEAAPKEGGSLFGKKFRMSFGSKRLGRSASVEASKAAVPNEKSDEVDPSGALDAAGENVDDSLWGVIQEIRNRYHRQVKENTGQPIPIGITPSVPIETPVLRPPPGTTVIIQEDRPDSGGVADLYRGTVATMGRDADIVENAAPTWLGRLLFWNQIPLKETVKVSFVLQPYQDLLPNIASVDGNSRLNANRMLRARKILAYVAERIEPAPDAADTQAPKPEEYLELYCQNQLIPVTMTLATLRAHVWKTGGDVLLYYKSNGKKRILGEKTTINGSGETPAPVNGGAASSAGSVTGAKEESSTSS
ncbi:MAG: hypothetical protein M1838_003976 [Thelocarpon superellum]|nr:MAG: hypothetical protein M1838_003976 [Thelocarpon superellum]